TLIYIKNLLLKDRRNDRIKLLKMSLQGLTDHRSGSRTPANGIQNPL
ncbi:MAG: hypothetical protein RI945_216, partial [Candidatus Parcubacteria bacterium]